MNSKKSSVNLITPASSVELAHGPTWDQHFLESSKSFPCSNHYLLLLIPFALAGLLLVIFLKSYNLTLSEGTINELDFYANIVQFNRAIVLKKGKHIDSTRLD